MKKIFLFAFALISILKLNAQSQCGTDEYDAFLKRTNPTYVAERQKMEQEIYSILKNKQNNPNARIGANDCTIPQSGVYTLPVVVHVIHKGEAVGNGTNTSDAEIIDAISGMNDQWRRVIGNGVDMEIQFALAIRDTNNNTTNGITRYDGRVFPRYFANGIHYSDNTTGANQDTVISNTVWDRTKYLNIWIADVRGAGGWASLFGNYTFFVSYNSDSYTYTHEMGHTFSLYHTFNGDGSLLSSSTQCPANNNCLLDGDWVCDTPPHRVEECITTSCSSSGDLLNSFKNYMSYCGGTTRFTQGQKDRAKTILHSYFWSLVMSDALMPVNTPLEVGIVSVENNLAEPVCNGFIPKIKVKNSGNATITTLKVDTYIDGSFYQTTTINTNLIKNNIQTYSLQTINFNTAGKHDLFFSIIEINGSTSDYQSLNNQICKDILVRNNPLNTICLNLEDSNINSVLFGLDTMYNPRLANISGCTSIGNKALKYNNSILLYQNNSFYLPAINLDSVYTAYLVFDHAYKQGKVSSILNLVFWGLKGCDSLPIVAGGFSSSSLASVTGRDSITSWIPTNCSHWKKDSVNLSNFKGINNLLIKCMAYNYNNIYFSNQDLYLDNFCIHKRYKITLETNIPNGSSNLVYSHGFQIYDESDTLSVIALNNVPNCYRFKHWEENGIIISTNPNYNFTVLKNRKLKAVYERLLIPLTLSTSPQNVGLTIGSGQYPCDTSVYISVTNIDTNYTFGYWYDSINNIYLQDLTSYPYISALSNNYQYTAYFTPKEYSISVLSSYAGSPQFNYNYSLNLPYNSHYSLIADTTGRDCYRFKNWTKNDIIVSTNPVMNIIINGNESYVANFERKQNIVTLTTNNIYGGSILGAGTYDCGIYVTLSATPNSCYNFKYWEENDILILSYNPSFTTYLYTDRNIKAVFEPKFRYNVTLTPNPSNGGIVIGTGNFACDTSVTVKAKIKTGYKFNNWTEASTIVSTDSNYTFRISANRNLKANFGLATGIKQTTINEISKIYPNPANDILQIEINSKQTTSITLNIIDIRGSLLETKTLTNSKGTFNTSFDVSKLAKGNYLLNLYDEDGMASYKFVVQ